MYCKMYHNTTKLYSKVYYQDCKIQSKNLYFKLYNPKYKFIL